MGWGAKFYQIFTPETTYATFNGSGTPFYCRAVGDSAFIMQSDPQRKAIMSAEGGNRRVLNLSSRVAVGAKLRTIVSPLQAASLLTWATDISAGDLTSVSIDAFDTIDKQRGLGAKVKQLTLSCAAETDEGALYADLDIILQQVSGTPPTISPPALSVYPGKPYTHQESSTGFAIASARAMYNNFKATWTNQLIPTFDELGFITNLVYCGRTIDLSTSFQYTGGGDRTAYDAQTAQAVSIAFTKASPAKVLTLNFQGQVQIAKRTKSLPLGGIARQQLDMEVFLDGTAGTDFAFTEV